MKEFTDEQLNALRVQWCKLSRVNPESKAYDELIKLLDACNDMMLKQLKDAQIRFVSSLALNRCIRRGLF